MAFGSCFIEEHLPAPKNGHGLLFSTGMTFRGTRGSSCTRILLQVERGVQVADGDTNMVQNSFHDRSGFTTKITTDTEAP